MPKQTFFNLPESKRTRLMGALKEEFAAHPYARASVDRVTGAAGVSKGSFYQYFDDKLDAYTHLVAGLMGKRIGLVGITWVVLGLPAVIWADSAWVGLQANQRFVETEIIQPLKTAAPGSEVVVSTDLPVPAMSYGFAFLMPRYEEAMKIYHDLPRDLHVTNP